MPAPTDHGLVAGVSVVVPSYQGVAYLGACLDSLAAQTMDPGLFEVIVVLNGAPDGSRELVTERAARHPQITWRVVELLDHPGVGRARNAGIAVARRAFIAMVDDDDTITPDYLSALYAHAAWDVVPMAWLDDVAPDGTVNESTHVNRILAQFAGQTVGVEEVPNLLSLNACKLLPLTLVRRVGYDIDLRSGVDVEFLTRLYANGRFRIHTLRRDEGATYLRSLRPGSVSRQQHTFEFLVEGRLDVIQRMSPYAVSPHPDVQNIARVRIAAQASLIRRYLSATPGDRQRVIDAINNRNLPWFAWSVLNHPGTSVEALPGDTDDFVDEGERIDELLAGVSVVVPSYQGVAYLGACLDSLAAQTMDPGLFEVIVVLNGAPDGSRELVTERAARHPQITWRVVELLDHPGVGRARNAGIAVARRAFIAMVDDDDTITPDYLSALYAHAAWDVVPMAWLDDVAPDGTVNESTAVNSTMARFAGQTVGVEEVPNLLSLNACKLLPLALVRRVGYDIDLRSGVDVEFLTRLYANGRFRIHTLRRDEGATYLRSLRPGSVSRQQHTFEFLVEGRLDVIQRISPYALSTHPDVRAVTRTVMRYQASFMRRHLASAPDDRERIIDAINNRNLPWFSVGMINHGVAKRLAISYCFAPYAGTAAIVAAKRIRAAEDIVDVVYNAMDSARAIDASTRVIADPYLDRESVIESPTMFSKWLGVETFCEQGWEAIEAAEAAKGPYISVWSRAMWPASHALAALHALRRPGIPWAAEFSDPLSRNVKGERRKGAIDDGAIAQELLKGLADAGVAVPMDLTMFELCELLAYALASELHFTNPNQLEFMLSYCPAELQATVRAKARVMPQPTLPQQFYEMADVSDHPLSTERVNIGYFGAFYVNRGIGEVLDAIDDLSPSERDRILLHVFTSDPKALVDSVAGRPAAEALMIEGYRPYLAFLALAGRMDALFVNDAATSGSAHSVNPYLPSKYSDYRGAGTKVWGHIEPGSPLSHEDLDLVSHVGDVGSVTDVLRSLLAAQHPARRTG